MLEIRFNILNKYVDKFVVSEAKYSHSGDKKKLNFNINRFAEFKKKIIYLVVDNEPTNILYDKSNSSNQLNLRTNSIKRIAHQRNKLEECLSLANNEDYIFYSDNDEIPDLENFNFKDDNNILIFKQKLFYYKFNLLCDRVDWFGTKGCKKKNFISFSWLREIKPKKYPFYRFDTNFSNTKYRNIKIINNGGWHFSQLKTAKDIEIKLTNQEHHDEYMAARENLPSVEDLIKRKTITYDHHAKSSEYKYSKEFKLKTLPIEYMPLYLQNNVNKYSEWFDNNK